MGIFLTWAWAFGEPWLRTAIWDAEIVCEQITEAVYQLRRKVVRATRCRTAIDRVFREQSAHWRFGKRRAAICFRGENVGMRNRVAERRQAQSK